MRPLERDDPRWVGTGGRRYRVLARVGSGGMGVVYLGRSPGGRTVAIKLVHAGHAADREFRDRFRREAALAGAVGGAFTAPVIDADPDAAVPWLVTEFLPSVSLGDAVRDAGPLPAGAVWELAAGIAEALASIHGAGVVHRDLKPANVLLTADGPRVIDFGIAAAVDATTATGARAGSPGFMSPEQVAGDAVGPAGDIFSFGSTLAFACTGAEPFGEGPWHAKMHRVRSEEPRLDGIADEGLRAVIASCMERDPSARPTAGALVERFAAARREGAWLPAAVTAEIGRRADAARNPPADPLDGRHRRVLRLGAVAAVAAVLGAGLPAAAWYVTAEAGSAPAEAAAPAATPAAKAQRQTPKPRTRALEVYITGDVRLTSMTFTVNGRAIKAKNVKLPYRKIVQVPPLPRKSEWDLKYRYPPGKVRVRVLVDGFERSTGVSVTFGAPGREHVDGTV